MNSVIRRDEVESFIAQWRENNKGKQIVFTNGCFDLLHIGHVRYLKEARSLGDFLFVGLNSDSSVRKLKGLNRPIQLEDDRAEILAALRFVDATCIFSEETPLELIKQIRPDILVKGGDWKKENIVGASLVESYGGKIFSLQFVEGKSTTSLILKSKS